MHQRPRRLRRTAPGDAKGNQVEYGFNTKSGTRDHEVPPVVLVGRTDLPKLPEGCRVLVLEFRNDLVERIEDGRMIRPIVHGQPAELAPDLMREPAPRIEMTSLDMPVED